MLFSYVLLSSLSSATAAVMVGWQKTHVRQALVSCSSFRKHLA